MSLSELVEGPVEGAFRPSTGSGRSDVREGPYAIKKRGISSFDVYP